MDSIVAIPERHAIARKIRAADDLAEHDLLVAVFASERDHAARAQTYGQRPHGHRGQSADQNLRSRGR